MYDFVLTMPAYIGLLSSTDVFSDSSTTNVDVIIVTLLKVSRFVYRLSCFALVATLKCLYLRTFSHVFPKIEFI